MIFGSSEPLESYCAHLLLSKDEIYFTILEAKGLRRIYGPRPAAQVHVAYPTLRMSTIGWTMDRRYHVKEYSVLRNYCS